MLNEPKSKTNKKVTYNLILHRENHYTVLVVLIPPPPSTYPPRLVKGQNSIFQNREFSTLRKIDSYG